MFLKMYLYPYWYLKLAQTILKVYLYLSFELKDHHVLMKIKIENIDYFMYFVNYTLKVDKKFNEYPLTFNLWWCIPDLTYL